MTLKINFKLFIIFFNVEGPPCATVVAFYKKVISEIVKIREVSVKLCKTLTHKITYKYYHDKLLEEKNGFQKARSYVDGYFTFELLIEEQGAQ